jgi:hypothetical protein
MSFELGAAGKVAHAAACRLDDLYLRAVEVA